MFRPGTSGILATAMLLVVGGAAPATARTWHVPSECPTIPAGLDSASYGDTVIVAPGIYLETGISLRPGVCLTSEAGAEATIIEICLGGTGIGISVEGARVSGFTIRNKAGPECHDTFSTYGIICSLCTDVIVEDCVIEDVSYGIEVVGPWLQLGMPIFRNNVIRNTGWGIECWNIIEPGEPGRPLFQGNTITRCLRGAYVANALPLFDGNEITNCRDHGIFYDAYCGGNLIRNVIANNQGDGVHIEADPVYAVPDFNIAWEPENANDFYGNGSWDIYYRDTPGAFIIASYNYWGSDCPNFSQKFHGAVYCAPWVDSTHTRVIRPEECPQAIEPATWGSIKAMFK